MNSRIHLNSAKVSAATIRVDALPLRRWHIDMTGTLGTCAFTGFTKMMVFRDESTGFKILHGSRHGCALEVVMGLIHIVGFFGLPDSVHTDGGPENDAYVWHQFSQVTGIKHTLSLPCQPHSNGIAESSIKTAKRFLRTLCVDLGRHNAWGLYLGIVQNTLNSLPCADRQCTPNQLVFASFWNPEPFVIPTFYCPQSEHDKEEHAADANYYKVGANFIHRATYIQQLVTNAYHEHMDILFQQAARKDPSVVTDIAIGQHVLIEWPDNGPPTPQHPGLRGPYIVHGKSHNVLQLQHLSIPPPEDQPATLRWSKHARVYSLDIFEHGPLQRKPSDPSATQVAAGFQSLHIDCITADVPKDGCRHDLNNVENRMYQARLWGQVNAVQAQVRRLYSYAEVQHTYAMDTYALCNPHLHGHTSVISMPMGWDPHAVSKSLRPAHYPEIPEERGYPDMSVSPAPSQ